MLKLRMRAARVRPPCEVDAEVGQLVHHLRGHAGVAEHADLQHTDAHTPHTLCATLTFANVGSPHVLYPCHSTHTGGLAPHFTKHTRLCVGPLSARGTGQVPYPGPEVLPAVSKACTPSPPKACKQNPAGRMATSGGCLNHFMLVRDGIKKGAFPPP